MQKTRIGVLVSGGGTNLQALINEIDLINRIELINEIEENSINGEIVIVLSDRQGAYALQRAENHGIKAMTLDKNQYADKVEYNKLMIKELTDMKVDLVVLAGFLTILTPEFVKAFEGRIINIHPSLIPSFCGKGLYGEKVHKAAIDYGVKVSGATVHFVDEGTDSGAIILQDVVKVDIDDTPASLAQKVLQIEHRLLPEAVRLYCNGRLKLEGRKVRVLS